MDHALQENTRLPIDLSVNPDVAKEWPVMSRNGNGDVNTGSAHKGGFPWKEGRCSRSMSPVSAQQIIYAIYGASITILAWGKLPIKTNTWAAAYAGTDAAVQIRHKDNFVNIPILVKELVTKQSSAKGDDANRDMSHLHIDQVGLTLIQRTQLGNTVK